MKLSSIICRLIGGYLLSGIYLGFTLLILNERGSGQGIPVTSNLFNKYFIFDALCLFPLAYLIVANWRAKLKAAADESNIQKAFEKSGESFATANFIPAYLYHGTMTGSSAAIFLLYYLVFLLSPLVLSCWLIWKAIKKLCLTLK
ncbi:hypothetical protein [Liquorilactobacillus sicerae]|uniref:hypothetical protein n=1 Tax=Liquorilactobacillus sicerae TaxID=1416943 RepID=UPI002480D19A|nr:hypothetical protein [Liquorilactobacillus sicerae]